MPAEQERHAAFEGERDHLFGIPEVIEWIGGQIALESGDIIVAGTPAGGGPIRHGDTAVVEIEGTGALANPVVEECSMAF